MPATNEMSLAPCACPAGPNHRRPPLPCPCLSGAETIEATDCCPTGDSQYPYIQLEVVGSKDSNVTVAMGVQIYSNAEGYTIYSSYSLGRRSRGGGLWLRQRWLSRHGRDAAGWLKATWGNPGGEGGGGFDQRSGRY